MILTNEEAQNKKQRIEKLKGRLQKIRDEKISFQGGAGNDEPYFMLLNQQEEITNKEIIQINQELATAEIVNQTITQENLVNDGDTVDLLITYDDGTMLSNTLTIVNHIMEYKENVISTSSPIGKAIYGKEIGSIVETQAPSGNIKIQIRGKVPKIAQEEVQQDTFTR